MTYHISKRTVTTTVMVVGDGGEDNDGGDDWEVVEVHFREFEGLSSELHRSVRSPRFTCFGHEWELELYPGGTSASADGYTSLYLSNVSSGSVELEVTFCIKNDEGKQAAHHWRQSVWEAGGDDDSSRGSADFAKRIRLLNALVDDALIVEVRMRQVDAAVPPFIPDNPLCKNILKKFDDEKTADVVFVVGGYSDRGQGDTRKKAKTAAVTFHSHRLVLQDSASTLSELAKSAADMSPIQITDVEPGIFHHMLHYIYGGKVLEADLRANAKDLIDAADKYGVVNLKLEAEACYVGSIELTLDNVLDNLLYADSINCALLKEVVVDFMVENGKDVLDKVSFEDIPGSVAKDLLTAITRGKEWRQRKDGDYTTMRVSTLRKKLNEKGLDIDGSREAMIARLKEHS